jgi:DHA2 family multidrug resistance protein
MVTISIMAAAMMSSLDTTIANVALPHIQGSVSASGEEISWVLTSYIIAAAIGTPLCGWLADRIGRKRLMIGSVIGFTAASGLCGLATNLEEIILFRLLQGVCGAALQPMSQAAMLDMTPRAEQAQAMAIWSMAAILGPILGPTLGGWLTEHLSWRWVFFINLPIGLLAALGTFVFMIDSRDAKPRPFDMFGFLMLAFAIGSLQLMLDRGQTQDWFYSTEVCIEAAAAALFFYLFMTHTLTARQPFVDLKIFRDRNFVVAAIFGFFLSVVLFGGLALLPPLLENLMGYSVVLTGLVTAPRGIGTMISMGLSGFMLKRMDPRVLIAFGFGVSAIGVYWMSGFSLQMDERLTVISGFLQGVGTGQVFVALSLMAFATLPDRYRNEGAAMFTLIRSIGGAAGISVLQALTVRNSAAVHSRLIEGIRPDNPILARAMPNFDFNVPGMLAAMNGQITRQAAMVAYADIFWLMALISLAVAPLAFLMRRPVAMRDKSDVTVHME